MRDLFIAALFFLGTHLGIPNSPLRGQLVASIGERPYRILYAALALAALAWLVHAWKAAPFVPLWSPGPGLRLVPLVLMPLACLLFVCALTQRNPTAIGQAPDPDLSEPARGITRITRHPFLWAVAIWAIGHILANGDLAALVFFGSFAILALLGSMALDARCTEARLPGWGVFVQRTSNLPFWPSWRAGNGWFCAKSDLCAHSRRLRSISPSSGCIPCSSKWRRSRAAEPKDGARGTAPTALTKP